MSFPMLALVVLLGLGHIVARTQGRVRLAGVLKPLPIALLAAVALRTDGAAGGASYRGLVGAALGASMAGDIFLLSPRRFVPGLVSFLIAHLIYIAALAPTATFDGAFVLLVPFVGFGALVLRHLWPHLGHHRAPVSAYVAVITTMGWLATLRALGGEVAPHDGLLALAGAFAFMASDTTLAIDRFARPIRGGQIVIMGTYYLAQTLLTLSAVT